MMSLVSSGFAAAITYTLLLGVLWPPKDRTDLAEYILGAIGKSLWLSWLVMYAAFVFNLKNPFPYIAVAVAGASAFSIYRGRRLTVVHPLLLILIAVITVIACVAMYLGSFGAAYAPIFGTWDALASWNRWAIELTQNTYKPYNAAYPILFPAIWSLVYKAQGTSDVWHIAKLTLFVCPTILAATLALLVSARRYLSAIVVSATIGAFFLSPAFPMFLGNADMPLAVMLLAAGGSMAVAISRLEAREVVEGPVLLASLFVGLAAVTKQAGIVSFAPLTALLWLGYRDHALNARRCALYLAIAIIPVATFLTMYLPVQTNPIGNVRMLREITNSAAGGNSPTLTALFLVRDMLPWWLWAAIGAAASINVFRIRTPSGILGLIFLAISICGFFAFANCCSYEARNGWWLVSLATTSAMLGLLPFEARRTDPKEAQTVGVGASATVAIVAATSIVFVAKDRITDEHALTYQRQFQWVIAGPEATQLVRDHFMPIVNGRYDALLTELESVKWLPWQVNPVTICGSLDNGCIRQSFQDRVRGGRTYVLVQRGMSDFPLLANFMTPDRLIAKNGAFELYGPLVDIIP